jgi:hypothetical protein
MHKTPDRNQDGLDGAIARALSEEDRALLARHAEPGYFTQATGLFRGTLGWTAVLVYAVGLLAFIGCAWAFWLAWAATHTLSAVKYGALAILLFQCSGMMKTYLGAQLQANRTLRELKRVELQVAMLREAGARG